MNTRSLMIAGLAAGLVLCLAACTAPVPVQETTSATQVMQQPADAPPASTAADKAGIEALYSTARPAQWGERLDGIVTQLDTDEKILALTLDACGGGFDESLIHFLLQQKIPATLFISGRWIEANPAHAAFLAKQTLFTIENHGEAHRPLSVSGQSVYGIRGTENPGEVYDEIAVNAQRIEQLTGRRPVFFRSGTAFYDDAALEIVERLGHRAAGYTIAGDEGATLGKAQIIRKCENPPTGAILLFHMNHPESGTAEGLQALLPLLQEQGWRFVLLQDFAGAAP